MGGDSCAFPMRLGVEGIPFLGFSGDAVESPFSAKECISFSDLHCKKPTTTEEETRGAAQTDPKGFANNEQD